MSRKLKMGMVGGGKDAFIRAVHRLAENRTRSGALLLLDPKRVYDSYEAMAETEDKLPVGQRIDFVSIVTPNFGWLLNPIDQEGQKQASWRTDPERAGASGCIGDIGTHAENLRAISQDWKSMSSARTFPPSSKGGASRTTETCLCAIEAAPEAFSTHLRFRPAKKIISQFGCMAQRHRWNDIRNIPMSSSLSSRTHPGKFSGVAIAI